MCDLLHKAQNSYQCNHIRAIRLYTRPQGGKIMSKSSAIWSNFFETARRWGSLFRGRKALPHSMDGSVALKYFTGHPHKTSPLRNSSSLPSTAFLARVMGASPMQWKNSLAAPEKRPPPPCTHYFRWLNCYKSRKYRTSGKRVSFRAS